MLLERGRRRFGRRRFNRLHDSLEHHHVRGPGRDAREFFEELQIQAPIQRLVMTDSTPLESLKVEHVEISFLGREIPRTANRASLADRRRFVLWKPLQDREAPEGGAKVQTP